MKSRTDLMLRRATARVVIVLAMAVVIGWYAIAHSGPMVSAAEVNMLDNYASTHSREVLGARYQGSTVICKTHPTGNHQTGNSIVIISQVLCQEYYLQNHIAYAATGMIQGGYFNLSLDKGAERVGSLHYIDQPVNFKTIPNLSKSEVNAAVGRGAKDLKSSADAAAIAMLHASRVEIEPLQ